MKIIRLETRNRHIHRNGCGRHWTRTLVFVWRRFVCRKGRSGSKAEKRAVAGSRLRVIWTTRGLPG